jgi:hypothetical protein
VSFVTITLCVTSQRVFVVVYFVMDSVRKFLDVPSYTPYTTWSVPVYTLHTMLLIDGIKLGEMTGRCLTQKSVGMSGEEETI